MANCDVACFKKYPPQEYRSLTLVLLDCWQREYDKRPYKNFAVNRLDLEERLKRYYDPVEDLAVITEFIRIRSIKSMQLRGLPIPSPITGLVHDFISNLAKLERIELLLMELPSKFFITMQENVYNMRVHELILSGTQLDDDHIKGLHSFLIKSKTLRCLDVSSCSITQYNFADLADGVHKSSTVIAFNASRLLGKHLTLDTPKMAMIFSSLIWKNQLQVLEFKMCEMNAQDMEIIAEYLYSKSSKLIKLNVAFNKIGADGARYLLDAISESGTLKHLDMSGCGIGSHGGEYVAMYLSSCYRLNFLAIGFNDISPETASLILLTIKKPCKLTTLKIWGNRYDPRTGKILRRLIDSGVMPQKCIDITYTFDDTIPGYRVIPWRP